MPYASRGKPLARLLLAAVVLIGCDRSSTPRMPASLPDEPSPRFRNVATPTPYAGDSVCAGCHARETAVYREHAMARSFHAWTAATRLETRLDSALYHAPTGLSYQVVDSGGYLYQVELIAAPDGRRLHHLQRRIDYVMGSGSVARTYFTEENGRLFQLPLTWYRDHGWDFSPGYTINNARFDRLMPDRCIACHSSYPRPIPFLEGKYAELRSGIGCERCHGPGALHVAERSTGARRDGAFDNTIVNPARLPLARRMDVCEQCHVHTSVNVLREGKDAFSFQPSQALRDSWAFFNVAGSIDIVSHADRLRQSACFLATRGTARPLECAACHNPHLPPPGREARNQPCIACHAQRDLERQVGRAARADHRPGADCARCHMPKVQERGIPHGTFTDHWIRVVTPGSREPTVRSSGGGPIEPFFERDRTGPEARIYQGMGGIVYATLANSARALANAASALDAALAADGSTPRGDARFLLGVAYHQLGRPAESIRALEQSVRADSSRPDRLRALAQAYERAGREAAAIEPLYRRALELQPALAWIRADYADFLHALGRRDEAERAYRAALAEQPSLAVAWFNLGALLAGGSRREDATGAFRRAVQLDPSVAQAVSQLVEIRTAGPSVVAVRALSSPLTSLPVRDRGPRAVQLVVGGEGGSPGVRFLNVPPGGVVQVLEPDGTLVRSLRTGDGWALGWDLRTETGAPIGGGLYRVQVRGPAASGQPARQQVLYFGVVRAE